MDKDGVPVFQFGAEGRGRQSFNDRRRDANKPFIGTIRRRGVRGLIVRDVADGSNPKN